MQPFGLECPPWTSTGWEKIIRSHGCIPSFKNYNGYPASICVSVNDEVVHGIPNRHRILKEGGYRQSGRRRDL